MVKEVKVPPKASESSQTQSRRKSPARTKSPSRIPSAQKSPAPLKGSDVVKRPGRPKSKTRSPVKIKSPSRNSPSRNSPARNRSPARSKKDTSPKRKSPSRTLAADAQHHSIKRATIHPTRIDTEFSGSDDEYIPKEKPKATVRGRSRKLDLDEVVQANVKLTERPDSINNYVEIRRSTRNVQAQEERVVHLKHFDTVTKKFGEFSDDDEISLLSSKPIEVKKKFSVVELIGIFLQILVSPVLVVSLYVFCNKFHCSFKSLPNWNQFKSFSVFFDLRSFLGYSALLTLLGVLSALPFGGRKVTNLPSRQEKFIYVANGISSLVIIVSACTTLEYLQIPVLKFIDQHILHLAISAFVFALLFSVYLFLRSFYIGVSALNPTIIDKPALNGFFYGREVNPRLLNVLDLKMYLVRVCCISLILADIALVIKGLNLNINPTLSLTCCDWKSLASHPTLLVLVTLHIIYSMDCLIFENRLLSSYFFQYEGLGYRTVVWKFLQPFLFIAQTKYVIDYQVHLAGWKLTGVSVIYLIGYILYRLSNNQKDSFRRNPYSPASANLESISTSHGKKLLRSGYWGLVRQPNILGDVLMHVALLPFCYNVPTIIGLLANVLLLIKRAGNVQSFCKTKYGTSWDKYCHEVKYVLVPKLY